MPPPPEKSSSLPPVRCSSEGALSSGSPASSLTATMLGTAEVSATSESTVTLPVACTIMGRPEASDSALKYLITSSSLALGGINEMMPSTLRLFAVLA